MTRQEFLVLFFPLGPFTPQSTCQHGPIPNGSALCCAVCHRSGKDNHPRLRRDVRVRYTTRYSPAPIGKRSETRKQRRARLFGARYVEQLDQRST